MISLQEREALEFRANYEVWKMLCRERGNGGGGGSHGPARRIDNGTYAPCKVGRRDGTQEVYHVTVRIEVDEDDSHDGFWQTHIRNYDDNTVIVNGKHYRVGPDVDEPAAFRGHGGRRFDIEFIDGRKVTTRNLWHQGTIPPKYRADLPDNATFVESDDLYA